MGRGQLWGLILVCGQTTGCYQLDTSLEQEALCLADEGDDCSIEGDEVFLPSAQEVLIFYQTTEVPAPSWMVDSGATWYNGLEFTAVLRWNSVVGADNYKIYLNGNLNGSSVGNTDNGGLPILYSFPPGFGSRHQLRTQFFSRKYKIVSRVGDDLESTPSMAADFVEDPENTALVCVDEGNGDVWGVNPLTNEGCLIPNSDPVEIQNLCFDEGNGDSWGVHPITFEGCLIVSDSLEPASDLCLDEGDGDNRGVNPITNEGCWINGVPE